MIAIVLVPLAGAISLFLTRGRGGGWIGPGTALATLAAVIQLAAKLWRDGPQVHFAGGWPAPLGINLYADGLSVMMLMMTAVTGVFVSTYSAAYFRTGDSEPRKQEWRDGDFFWPLWLFLWAGMNALFVSADIFNLYVILEIVTLSAVAMAIITGATDALRAGLRYLLSALAGSMAYLMGVALTYATFDALDFRVLSRAIETGSATALALALMTSGLLLKAALFPMHFWLPPAHSAAAPPASAVLSALVIKGSFYMLLRLWFDVFDKSAAIAAGQILGALGAAAIFWGSLQAIRQQRIKLLIAHSTVAQVGYLFLLFPLLTAQGGGREAAWMVEAWTGGVYQAVSHALAKAAMFLAAGVIVWSIGTDRLEELRDVAGRLPLAVSAFGLAGMSLIGLPPSGGFAAKWMLMKAVIASGQWWWLPVIALGGLLTAGYVFLLLRHMFQASRKGEPLHARRVPMSMQISALALAAAAVVIGLRLEEPLALLQMGELFPPLSLERDGL